MQTLVLQIFFRYPHVETSNNRREPCIWVIAGEKKYLSSLPLCNRSSFVQKITKARTAPRREPVAEDKSTAVFLCVQGVSQSLCCCLEQQGIGTVFEFDTTLWSHLVWAKDTINLAKQDVVVHRIPCECSKVYIGEIGRPMQERIKEHYRDIRLACTETTTISEQAHKTSYYPIWNKVKFIDWNPHSYTHRVKEAIRILRLQPNNINRDSWIAIPVAWMPTIRNTGERFNSGPLREQLLARTIEQWEDQNASITANLCNTNEED